MPLQLACCHRWRNTSQNLELAVKRPNINKLLVNLCSNTDCHLVNVPVVLHSNIVVVARLHLLPHRYNQGLFLACPWNGATSKHKNSSRGAFSSDVCKITVGIAYEAQINITFVFVVIV